MARGKKKKQSLSQNLVGLAASGLPSPIRNFLSRPIISIIVVVGFIASIATGLVFVTWENGVPHLSVNEKKAAEAKQRASARIEEFRKGQPNSSANGLEKTWAKFVSEQRLRESKP
jgi:hypothetical protein